MIAATENGNPWSEVALVLAVVAFLALLVEVFWLRKRRDIERQKRIPLEDAPTVARRPRGAEGAESDDAR